MKSPAVSWILIRILDSHGELAFTEFAGGEADRLSLKDDLRKYVIIN
jgi:hypothetical protein